MSCDNCLNVCWTCNKIPCSQSLSPDFHATGATSIVHQVRLHFQALANREGEAWASVNRQVSVVNLER